MFMLPLLFFVLSLHSLPHTNAITNPDDVAALAALKSSIQQASIPPWSCIATWNFTSDPCNPNTPTHFTCGISCTKQTQTQKKQTRIAAISLDPVGYAAYLNNVDFSKLSMLAILDVNSNAFYGPIPSSIANLSALDTLIMSSNAFTGPIPTSISRLTALKIIDLSRNKLSGAIPESLALLKNINIVDFSSNRLSGNLPRRLPASLSELALRDNLLSGQLMQTSFSSLNNLQVLELGSNKFDGKLEGWLILLPSLQQFSLNNNSIQTLQLWSPRATSKLVALDLGFNNISGGLPVELANFPALVALSMRRNRLTGGIPWQYVGAKKGSLFRRMFVDGNFLNGKVPQGFLGGVGSELVGSFGDNCLQNCPATVALCSPAQKPVNVCKEIYGIGMKN